MCVCSGIIMPKLIVIKHFNTVIIVCSLEHAMLPSHIIIKYKGVKILF
jgi:hypothetical protein